MCGFQKKGRGECIYFNLRKNLVETNTVLFILILKKINNAKEPYFFITNYFHDHRK